MTDLNLNRLVAGKLIAVVRPRADAVGLLRAAGAKDVLVMTPDASKTPERHESHVTSRFRRLSDLARNNCQIAILNGVSAAALFNKRFFGRLEHVLVGTGLAQLCAAPGLLRYTARGRLKSLGTVELRGVGRYRVYECNAPLRNNRTLYGPTGKSPLEILRSLQGLDYAVLRWIEDMESGKHEGDIDMLIRGSEIGALRERLRASVGTYPIDVYTHDGREGHTYKSVPYFVPAMADKILRFATVRKSGIRAPSAQWRYLLFRYHLLFQNKSGYVPAGQEVLEEHIFPGPKYLKELQRLARCANVREPMTFSDLESDLAAQSSLPGIDLIGFYSVRNPFLKRRYLDTNRLRPGLSVFYVRDFGEGLKPVPDVRSLLKETFKIVAEGPVTREQEPAVLENVRGGNWYDHTAPGGTAKPIYWFVCWDETPEPPTSATLRKHPRVDNERIQIKSSIREAVGAANGVRRLIHSSDNSREAIEHIEHLGIGEDHDVAAVIGRSRVTGAP